MRTNVKAALAIGCASLLMSSISVSANPSPDNATQTLASPIPKPKPKQTAAQPAKPTLAADKKKKKTVQNVRAPEARPAARQLRVEHRVAYASADTRPRLFSAPDLVSEARKYMGTNPTDSKKLWCARFMNFVLARVGYAGTGSDAAKSFAYYGKRISEPRVGAIAVLTRGKNGGHVGVVTGVDKNGNPIIVSGNHNKRVGEAVYSRARVIAYVMPTDRRATGTQVASASRPSSDGGFESPITELIAAIQSERDDSRTASTQRAEPAVPHRVVQQTGQPQAAAGRRDLPLDPALAELLGIKAKPQPAAGQAPQRQLRVEQSARARIAAFQQR